MEDHYQCSPFNAWGYIYQEEGMEDLKQSLLYTTFELETTILSAKEAITKKEFELIHLKDVLNKTIKERDEAQTKCKTLIFEKLILQNQLQQNHHQQQQPPPPLAAAPTCVVEEDEPKGSDFECKTNMVSSPVENQTFNLPLPEEVLNLVSKKGLPEKGKLLQAVMEAGPLLQTLLLAGPLPQWQHPPPQLDPIQIPPVSISSSQNPTLMNQNSFNSLLDSSSSSPDPKRLKVVALP